MTAPVVGTELTGRVIASQFRILDRLGEGGMGVVYRAQQLGMEREVVVKVLHPHVAAQIPNAADRFRREAQAVARLNHPNIVQVYVFGQMEDGRLYIAMEFIAGRTMDSLAERGRPWPEARVLRIADQICSALGEAHRAGVVHRDLKPENIMLSARYGMDDYVKVLDFGIAKLAARGDAALTHAGTITGTPRYMAPEQVRAETVDPRTDIYAVGLLLYELLSGHHALADDAAPMEYVVLQATQAPVPLSVRFPQLRLTPRAERMVMKCLAKDPSHRFQTAAELQTEVRGALQGHPTGERDFPTPPAAPRGSTSSTPAPTPTSGGTANNVLLGLVAAAVLAGTGYGAYRLFGSNEADTSTPTTTAENTASDDAQEPTARPDNSSPENRSDEQSAAEEPESAADRSKDPGAAVVTASEEATEGETTGPTGAESPEVRSPTSPPPVVESVPPVEARGEAQESERRGRLFPENRAPSSVTPATVSTETADGVVRGDPDSPSGGIDGVDPKTVARDAHGIPQGAGPLGVVLPKGVTPGFQTDQLKIFNTNVKLEALVKYYHALYSPVKGAMVVQQPMNGRPRLVVMLVNTPAKMRMLVVQEDPTNALQNQIIAFTRE